MTRKPFKHIAVVSFIVFALISFISCPADPIQPGNSGTIPYESPYAPKNVTATCGEKDTLTISWDAVENADMYIIYGIEASKFGSEDMEEYARTNSTSYTFNLNGSGNGSYRLFDPDESYIFSVETWINYGSSTDNLISAKSSYVEGCFAPTTIDFYAVVTYNKLRLYWSCGNLFSTLNTSSEISTLYDPVFTVEYRGSSDSSDSWKTIEIGKETSQYVEIDTADEGLVYGNSYVFRVSMQIKGEDGSTILSEPVMSNEKTVLIDIELTPKDVTDLTVSQGTYADKIRVTWTIPTWGLDISRENSYFIVYRSESQNGPWTNAVVNEMRDLSNPVQSNLITEDGGTIVFEDIIDDTKPNSPERGKKYYYKIINGAMDTSNDQLYAQVEEDVKAITDEGYAFYIPEDVRLTGTWSAAADNLSAAYTLEISGLLGVLPADLEYEIREVVQHVEANEFTETDTPITVEGTSYSKDDGSVSISSCTCGYKTQHIYSYYLVVEYNGADLYEELPFEFDTDTVIGAEVTNFIIDTLSASNDFVGAIRITWTEKNAPSSDVTYEYKIIGTEDWVSFDPGQNKYFDIADLESGKDYRFQIRARIDAEEDYVTSPESKSGRVFDISAVGLTATKGEYNDRINVTWNGEDPAFFDSENLVYTLNIGDTSYSGDDFRYSYSSYEYAPDYSTSPDEYGKEIKFSISAYNTIQGESEKTTTGEASEGAATGYIVPVPVITSASKGTSRDTIDIEWTCSLSAKVSSYNIKVYNEEGNEIHSENSVSGNSYTFNYNEIAGISEDKYQDFTFEIKAVDSANSVESICKPQDGYQTEKNNFKQDEAVNIGYFFDDTAFYDNVEFIEATDPVDASYIADYLTVKFPANKTVEKYMVSGYSQTGSQTPINRTGDIFEFNIDDLTIQVDTYYTNGMDPDELGYIAFDPDDEMITVNTSTGVLDDTNGYVINHMSISGEGSSSDLTTNVPDSPIACGKHRGFNKYDYLNAFNKIMNEALHEIEDGKNGVSGIGDWVGYHYNTWPINNDDRASYITTSLEALQDGSPGGSHSSDGYIKFTGYTNNIVKLTSDGNIDFVPTGYGTVNDQGINYIGQDGIYSLTMEIEATTYIGGSSELKFKDATIDLTRLNIAAGMPGCELHITAENGIDEDLNISTGTEQADFIYNLPY